MKTMTSGTRLRVRAFGFVLGVVVVGCGQTTTPTGSASVTPLASLPTAGPAATPTGDLGPSPSASASPVADCVDRTLDALTEAQRVGQLLMIGLRKDRLDPAVAAAIAESHVGSVAFTDRSSIGVITVRALTDEVQALATVPATDGVRFFVAANQEGGQIQTLSGPGFSTIPSAVDQGSMATNQLRAMAARWGAELISAGVNLDLAPVADVVPAGTEAENAPIGQLERQFGSDPTSVARHVRAFIAGMHDAGEATTAKHFPGLGRVAGNTDFTGDVVDTVTGPDDPFLQPFAWAIDAGVPFVMVSLATYRLIDPDHLAVFSPDIIGGILGKRLGFDGVVISDALGATAVQDIPAGSRAVDFIAAGGDMIISNQTSPADKMAAALVSRADVDPTFRARVDDAARHVLTAKDAAGLLPCT
jgi:beta-N-acetylhexosaminidase